jgi:hypothetical protein
MIDNIKNKLNDQDFNQQLTLLPIVLLEFYRVIISSFLILFVPQKCVDHVCSYEENMESTDSLYDCGLAFNFITMFVFLVLYTIEIKRENKLIKYLEVNKNLPLDNISVGNAIEKLSDKRKNKIWKLDYYYQIFGKCTIIFFSSNAVLSGLIIYDYYLDNKTTMTFITNILFMINKLYDIYSITNTEKNIFYSAYMKSKMQFNDVDPNKNEKMNNILDTNIHITPSIDETTFEL